MNIKSSFVTIYTLIIMAAIPAVGSASPARPGGYMSGFLGASVPQNADATISQFNPVSTRDARVEYDPGINLGVTGGYDFGFLRLEGEMSYKQAEMTAVSAPNFGTRYVNVDGHIGAFAMMLNSFFDLHNESPVTPYLGGGMGFAALHINDVRGVDASSGALNNHIFSADDDNVFAYQFGAGVDLALSRRLSIDLGYRYFATSKASFRKDWPNSTDLKFESHNAAVGLRIKF
jgi:opacity protein-like surface antigen